MSSKIVFCGVGALGSTTAVLCRNLDVKFSFIDSGKVNSENITCQAFIKHSAGKNKAVALKLQLMNFYGIKADAFTVQLAEDNIAVLLNSADLIVDCLNHPASCGLLSDYARNNNKNLLHGGISADRSKGFASWEEGFKIENHLVEESMTCKNGEYLPIIGMTASLLAQTIQLFINNGIKKDFSYSLNTDNNN